MTIGLFVLAIGTFLGGIWLTKVGGVTGLGIQKKCGH